MFSIGRDTVTVRPGVVFPSTCNTRNVRVWTQLRAGGLGNDSFPTYPQQQQTTHKCYNVSIYSIQNKRPHMEDEYFQNSQGSFVSIMDGHGGGAVSKYIRQNLYARFLQAQANILCEEKAHVESFQQELGNENLTSIRLPDEWLLAHAHDASWKSTNHPIAAEAHVQFDHTLVILPSSSSSVQPWTIPHPIQSPIQALRTAFETIDNEILKVSHWSFQGSTVCAILLQDLHETAIDSLVSPHHQPSTAIIAANVGDSRAVLCRGGIAIPLTIDHKPNHPLERSRIEKLGGKVQWSKAIGGKENIYIVARTTHPKTQGVYRINGNLALSRALGDRSERPLISSEVDISYTILNESTDEFIILASDGLWDVFDNNQDVVNLVRWILDKQSSSFAFTPIQDNHTSLRNIMAQLLVEEAIRRGATDNISVAIIYLG